MNSAAAAMRSDSGLRGEDASQQTEQHQAVRGEQEYDAHAAELETALAGQAGSASRYTREEILRAAPVGARSGGVTFGGVRYGAGVIDD